MADFTDVDPTTPGVRTLDVLISWNDQPSRDFQDQFLFIVPMGNDATIPSLANFAPAEGAVLAKYDPIAFDVTDALFDGSFQTSIHISVYIVATDTTEMAWGGEDNVGQPVWENQYNTSTRSAISGGYHFIIRRRGGWPSGGVRIKVRAVDRAGNVGVL